jgi:RNA recognition motif-containing protein
MRLFVGNLPFATTKAELSQVFAFYGVVASVLIVLGGATGRSRGFGFVEMPDPTEAQAAIDGLQGATLGGRALIVDEARPRADQERPRRLRR